MYLEDQKEQIYEVSISVELLHSGHLIYDDLLDNDTTRRGKPTFHVQLKNEINQVYKDLELPNKDELIRRLRETERKDAFSRNDPEAEAGGPGTRT